MIPDDRDGSMPIDRKSSFALVLRARRDQRASTSSSSVIRSVFAAGPTGARRLGARCGDTNDLVQDTMLKVHALRPVPATAPGAFLAYVRQTLQNTITDRIRGAHRRRPIDRRHHSVE
jgi:DNA-directed RNA polymerase specialized sigma24 family protein